MNPLKNGYIRPILRQNSAIRISVIAEFFLVYDKNVSFLSATWQFLDRFFLVAQIQKKRGGVIYKVKSRTLWHTS